MTLTFICKDWQPYNFVSRHNYLSLFTVILNQVHLSQFEFFLKSSIIHQTKQD